MYTTTTQPASGVVERWFTCRVDGGGGAHTDGALSHTVFMKKGKEGVSGGFDGVVPRYMA